MTRICKVKRVLLKFLDPCKSVLSVLSVVRFGFLRKAYYVKQKNRAFPPGLHQPKEERRGYSFDGAISLCTSSERSIEPLVPGGGWNNAASGSLRLMSVSR